MSAEHLTSNMVTALRQLADTDHEGGLLTSAEIGRHLDIRHTKGSYLGQSKVFGRGAAAASVLRALNRRGLVEEKWIPGRTWGFKITEAGRQKLSEVSETMSA